MSVSSFDPNTEAVTMTAAAVKHFEKALNGQEGKLVRLATETNGCSGYAYVLDLVDAAEDNDVVLRPDEKLVLAVAADAVDLLRGTEIDMVTEGVNRVVKFNNPNVTGECGCGESFSVS